MSDGDLAGRRVLVVGAGTQPSPDPDAPTGNGRAISILAGRRGATVICADRDEAAAAHTAELVEREGASAEVVVADVAVNGSGAPAAAGEATVAADFVVEALDCAPTTL